MGILKLSLLGAGVVLIRYFCVFGFFVGKIKFFLYLKDKLTLLYETYVRCVLNIRFLISYFVG